MLMTQCLRLSLLGDPFTTAGITSVDMSRVFGPLPWRSGSHTSPPTQVTQAGLAP